MTGADFRDVSPNVTLELIPGHASALTPSPERVQPCPADLGSVHAEPFQVPGDRVVVQVSLHHAGEPTPSQRLAHGDVSSDRVEWPSASLA